MSRFYTNISNCSKNYNTLNASNGSWYPTTVPLCLKIQAILLWDLLHLVPNVLFALFLLLKWYRFRRGLGSINFPLFTAFFNLILLISILSIIRCLVTIFVKPDTYLGSIFNKVVWLVVRLGQLSTELSVLIFGLFFARFDSRKSIMKILLLSITISLIYILVQGTLEIITPDKRIIIDDNHYYDFYGHGGMIFWFVSSTIFAIMYIIITILPIIYRKRSLQIPTNKSFYGYCMTLSIVCSIQSIGSILAYINLENGFCFLDATTFLYFTMFGPFVYVIFLRKFFVKEKMIPNNYIINDDSIGTSNASHSYSTTSMINSNEKFNITPDNNYNSLKSSNEINDSSSSNILKNSNKNYSKNIRSQSNNPLKNSLKNNSFIDLNFSINKSLDFNKSSDESYDYLNHSENYKNFDDEILLSNSLS